MSARYSILPARVVGDRRLSDPTFRTLGIIGTYSGDQDDWCLPSQSAIAKRLGVSPQTISKCLAELVSLGYLEERRQFAEDGTELPSFYRIRFDTEDEP